MTAKQLESLVNGIPKPNLIESEVKLLLNEEDAFIKPIPRPQAVAQPYYKPVTQPVAQPVAQVKPKVVAQEVAQAIWVAQDVAKKVAQPKSKVVAQDRPQVVAQNKPKQVAQSNGDEFTKELSVLKYVKELQDKMKAIIGIEERKRFANGIGWGIMCEKRGKQYYLFGGKKLNGKKRKLYIGNAKK